MKWLLLLLGLVGCSAVDSEAPPAWAVDTVANGAIHIANSGVGLWDQEGAWRLTPEIVLGEIAGEGATVFGSIRALQADDEGRIYVADGQANELRIFAADGTHLRTVGRAGEGPGEFTGLNGLLWLGEDSLLVVDQPGGRYSVYTRDGAYVRSVPRRLGFWGYAFSGGLVGGHVYEDTFVGEYPDLLPILLRLDVRPDADAMDTRPQTGSELLRTRPDTVKLPTHPEGLLPELFELTNDQEVMLASMPIPFAPEAVYHLDGSGSVWHAHGSEFRLIRTTLAGDTLMEVTLDATPAPVSQADVDQWLSSEIAELWRSRGWPYATERIPEVKPYLDEIYVDRDGFVWVSVPALQGEVAFELFDPAGRHLGRLQVNGFERLFWVPPVVRAGRLYLAGRNEFDVERVYVFRIGR